MWHDALMQDAMPALLWFVLTIAAWFAPVVFFVVGNFIAARAAGENQKALQLITWLLIVIWLLICALVYAWLGPFDGDY